MTIEQPCEPFRLNAARWWEEVERLENQLEALYEMAPAEWIERTWARCVACGQIKHIIWPHTHCFKCRDAQCQTCIDIERIIKEAENDECPF